MLRQQLAEFRSSATGSHPAIAATLLARSKAAASAPGGPEPGEPAPGEASNQEAPTQEAPTQEAPTQEAPTREPSTQEIRAGQAGSPGAVCSHAGPPHPSRRRRPGARRVTAPRTPSPPVPAPRVPGTRPPAAMTDPGRPPEPGPDGRLRCPWALSAPEELPYHDEEWGRPVRDDRGIFERLCPWRALAVRPVLAHDLAQAGKLPGRVRRLRPGRRGAIRPGRRDPAARRTCQASSGTGPRSRR